MTVGRRNGTAVSLSTIVVGIFLEETRAAAD